MKVITCRHAKNLNNYSGFIVIRDRIYPNHPTICHIKNGLVHNTKGPAIICLVNVFSWCYKGVMYGINYEFKNKTWKKEVKQLILEEKLKIFK